MTLHAVVYIDAQGLLLSRTTKEFPEAKMEVEHQASADSLFVSIQVDDQAGVERSFGDNPSVGNARQCSEDGERRVYQIDFEMDRRLVSQIAADLGINLHSSKSERGDPGWTVHLEVPDREALIEFREILQKRNIGFELLRLSQGTSTAAGPFDLSEKQREALVAAYENGYFEIPRGISQQGLAKLLGASPTAVSQRLRRATQALIAATVAGKGGSAGSENAADIERPGQVTAFDD